MDSRVALNILKIDILTSIEDLDIQYDSQKSWILKSMDNASSESVKASYALKIAELDNAYSFLKADLEGKKANERNFNRHVNLPRLKKVQWLVIAFIVLLVSAFGLKYILNKNEAEKALSEGLVVFEKAKMSKSKIELKKALSLFRVSMEDGSAKGKFYHGITLFKLGSKQVGLSEMRSAEQEGFTDTTIDFRFYTTYNSELNSH